MWGLVLSFGGGGGGFGVGGGGGVFPGFSVGGRRWGGGGGVSSGLGSGFPYLGGQRCVCEYGGRMSYSSYVWEVSSVLGKCKHE